MARVKHPVDIIYEEADNAQKIWVEATNKYFQQGGQPLLKKSFDVHIAQTLSLAESILARLPKKPMTVADIGAGFGGVAINLALMGIHVIAIEPSKDERAIIRYYLKKFPKARNNLVVKNGFAENLPIASNSIDLCILSQVLEHVKDPVKTLAEVQRVLKVGGYCHLSSPNYLFPAEQHYHVPYLPLMPKKLFSKWALFLYRTINIRKLKNVQSKDFLKVEDFIFSLNYTTDTMIQSLFLKNNLSNVWSFKQQAGFWHQVKAHYLQNPTNQGFLLVLLSSPLKFIRSILFTLGILPMKLEYLIVKEGLKKSKVKKIRRKSQYHGINQKEAKGT